MVSILSILSNKSRRQLCRTFVMLPSTCLKQTAEVQIQGAFLILSLSVYLLM